MGRVVLGRVVVLAVLGASPAWAQRAEDVQAAAAAFSEGQRAQLRGEYGRAAELFEVADQVAPSPAALRSAIRNHREAGHLARAATLAARGLQRHPEDAETRALADEVIALAQESLGELRIACAPACALTLDGRAAWHEPIEGLTLYVEPGARRLAASWPRRGESVRELSIEAGAREAIALEPEAVVEPEPQPEPVITPTPTLPDTPRRGGVDPAFLYVGAGLTALGVGLTIASGVDTLAARDAYVLQPTREGYEDGVGREWRTNGLLFGTIAVGIATAVLGLFTDFGGGALVAAAPVPGGALAFVSGSFEGEAR